MKCRDCQFLSEPTTFGKRFYPSVRCTKGLWDKEPGTQQWHSFGECVLNRGPVRRYGEKCAEGKLKGEP